GGNGASDARERQDHVPCVGVEVATAAGGRPSSGLFASSTCVISEARSGSVVVRHGSTPPRSSATRTHCPYWKSRLGGYRQGFISDWTTIVRSMPRNIPCGGLPHDMASSRSTRRRRSSRVVGRLDTTNTSRSLLGRNPPRTAEPRGDPPPPRGCRPAPTTPTLRGPPPPPPPREPPNRRGTPRPRPARERRSPGSAH